MSMRQRWVSILASITLVGAGWMAAAAPPPDGPGGAATSAPAAREFGVPVATKFVEVRPTPSEVASFQRSRGQTRAVVLIHGLYLHPFSNEHVNKPAFRDWQKPGSPMVETLAKDADVYAFAYSQNLAVDAISGVPGLEINVWRLKAMGYQEIVLVGHSAGGLIAREFVEDHPLAGVTKVIQVCAPNRGSGYARIEPGISKSQKPFLTSLTKQARLVYLARRADKKIPEQVEFVCVVGDGSGTGDWLVSVRSQWPRDLQDQGIPAVAVRAAHFTVMHSKADAERIAELVRAPQPRWSADKVAALRKTLKD